VLRNVGFSSDKYTRGLPMPDGSMSAAEPLRPTVTLGMPVYNSERFLAASLDSLLKQDFHDFELIISDNASTDRSGEICREYAARDSRIRYVRQPRNIGAVANWNYLVHVARGRYFKWASSNDVCAPQLLSLCVAGLEARRDAVLCYGRTALIDDDGSVLGEYPYDVEILDARASIRFRRACLEMRLNNAQCAVMRLDVLRRTGLERSFPEGDMPLMAELALHGGFRRLPEVLLFRRMGKQSATRYLTPEQKAAFRNPETVGNREYVVWPTTWDYLESLGRAPISLGERLQSTLCVLRQLYWARREAAREFKRWLSSHGVAAR
jgi:glycosyltransferase involved in cell wall biosynthesis